MDYRLSWMNHWSTKHEAEDPRVLIRYAEESDGWWEHEYIYYFMADSDEQAKEKALAFINSSSEEIEIFSVTNRKTKEVIFTEEEL